MSEQAVKDAVFLATSAAADILAKEVGKNKKLVDRIEVLEAALREIIAECSYRSAPIKTPQSTEDIFMIARAALDKDKP